MKVKVTDLNTGTVTFVETKNPILHRVMSRAIKLYRSAKNTGIKGISMGYYLQYSWKLEKGFCWINN